MKNLKIAILFLLVTLVSNNIFAQEQTDSIHSPLVILTYKNLQGDYNRKTKEYEYGDYVFENVQFEILDNLITIKKEIPEFYKVVKFYPIEDKDNYKKIKYLCEDQDGVKCVFLFVNNKESNNAMFAINYDNVSFVYNINQ